MNYDLFISHADEDKPSIVRPVAGHLSCMGYSVWLDELSMAPGDSLRTSIDAALTKAGFGLVVLSPSFFKKDWPQYELNGLVAREMASGNKVIVPLWHNVSHAEVAAYSASLADRLAIVSTLPVPRICEEIARAIGKPRLQNERLVTSSQAIHPPRPVISGNTQNRPPNIVSTNTSRILDLCPRCGQEVDFFGYDGSDGDSFDWMECSHCGLFKRSSSHR